MEKRQKIEELFFEQNKTIKEISEELNLSNSYVSRVLKQNINYHNEKERRKQEKLKNRREVQKNLIYNERKKKARENYLQNQFVKQSHEQASRELSKSRKLGNDALRKWCSLYNYNKKKNCYEFDISKANIPNDFPKYIKA